MADEGAISRIIKGRRSIRRYKSDPVSDADLKAVLEAFRWAPSWGNTQCWEVVVVDDPVLKGLLESSLPTKNSAVGSILQAPLVLAVAAQKGRSGYYHNQAQTHFGDWMLFDCALAVQNACLTAHARGLGTVILGQFDHSAVEKALGVPEEVSIICLIPIGYSAKESLSPSRRSQEDFVHRNKY